jgi:hypothetical protein
MMMEVAVGARIVKTEPRMNSKVHVEIEVTTPGPFGTTWTLPFLVDDQGDAIRTGQAAYRELAQLLEEAKSVVQSQILWP